MLSSFRGKAPNPFDSVKPDFTVFGIEFAQTWQKLLGGVWGLAFVVVAFGLIRAILELQSARRSGYPVAIAEHSASLKRSVLALAALASLGIVFGAILSAF